MMVNGFFQRFIFRFRVDKMTRLRNEDQNISQRKELVTGDRCIYLFGLNSFEGVEDSSIHNLAMEKQ